MSLHENLLPLSLHLKDLRKTLILALSSFFIGVFIAYLIYPRLIETLKYTLPGDVKWVILSPQEGFIEVIRIVLNSGILLSSPFWLFFIARFILPGLKKEELRIFPLFLMLCLADFILGAYIALTYTVPLTNQYLIEFNQSIGLNTWRLAEYLDYVFMLCFANIALLLIGTSLFLLIHTNIIPWRKLASKRKSFIIGSLIIGALLTPPDIFSQIALAVPLLGFYEAAILYGRLMRGSNVD